MFRDPGNFADSNYSRMRKVKPGDIFIVRTDRFYNDTAKEYIGQFKGVADGQVISRKKNCFEIIFFFIQIFREIRYKSFLTCSGSWRIVYVCNEYWHKSNLLDGKLEYKSCFIFVL